MVGLLPLLAVASAPSWVADEFARVHARLRWSPARRSCCTGFWRLGPGRNHLQLSLLEPSRLARVMEPMSDRPEFISPYGSGRLSAGVSRAPTRPDVDGQSMTINTRGRVADRAVGGQFQTGAVRCGSRSTCCSPTRCAPTERLRRGVRARDDTIDQRLVACSSTGTGTGAAVRGG